MRNKLAVVFCVHHRPWLIMSTLITLMLQDDQDFDVHVIYNVDPSAERAKAVNNPQLSPFDERVREVCQLKGRPIVEHEFENDEALDSGAWYKFLRGRHWLGYDWVLFVGEGTLFARPRLLSGMLALTSQNPNVHVIASGHEKRRIAKDQFFSYCERQAHASDADRLHDRMIAEGFDIFGRDPAFRRLIDAWGSGFPVETEHHVPESGPPSEFLRRIRTAWIRRWGRSE